MIKEVIMQTITLNLQKTSVGFNKFHASDICW